VWKWFDDRSGRWTNYGSSNNKSIDDAYREGKSSVRLVLIEYHVYVSVLNFLMSKVLMML